MTRRQAPKHMVMLQLGRPHAKTVYPPTPSCSARQPEFDLDSDELPFRVCEVRQSKVESGSKAKIVRRAKFGGGAVIDQGVGRGICPGIGRGIGRGIAVAA